MLQSFSIEINTILDNLQTVVSATNETKKKVKLSFFQFHQQFHVIVDFTPIRKHV